MAVGPNKPVRVAQPTASRYGVAALGSSAFEALQPFDQLPEFVAYKAAGCSSCSGRSKTAKAPLEVPVRMIIQAAIDTETIKPKVLAARDATVLKGEARTARVAGVDVMADAFINASALTMAGTQARQAKIVPFNPYHPGSQLLHRSDEFKEWAAKAAEWLAGGAAQSEAIPETVAEILAFLDANPDRVGEVEAAELVRSRPRVTVKDRIVQIRAANG